MGNFCSSLVTVAAIDPNKKDLDAGTISSVVITGIVVVFIGLILLIVCVSIYGAIFNSASKKRAQKAEAEKKLAEKAAEPVEAVMGERSAPAVEDGIEEETVAVIMAAIAAMSASSGKKLVLKSVKTSKPQRSAWSSAGIVENTRPF